MTFNVLLKFILFNFGKNNAVGQIKFCPHDQFSESPKPHQKNPSTLRIPMEKLERVVEIETTSFSKKFCDAGHFARVFLY